MRESQVWFLQCLLSLSLRSISRMQGCDLAASVGGGDRKRQTVYCTFLTPVFDAQCWSYFGKLAQTYSEVCLFTSPREHFIPSMSAWMLPPLRPLAQLRDSRLRVSSLLYQTSYTWAVLCCDGVYCLPATLCNFLTLWETFLLNLQAVARSMLILTWIDKLEIFHSGIQHCLPWRGVNKLKWKSPTSFWHVWTRL